MCDGLSAAGESGRGNVICANRKPMLLRRMCPQPLAAPAVVTGAFAAGPVAPGRASPAPCVETIELGE
jgi:hypothetical protein